MSKVIKFGNQAASAFGYFLIFGSMLTLASGQFLSFLAFSIAGLLLVQSIREKVFTFFGLKGLRKSQYWLPVVVIIIITPSLLKEPISSIPKATIKTQPEANDSSSEATKNFVEAVSQFGKLIRIEDTADWAEGKRKWVTTDNGSYLFYLKGNAVITVYQQMESGVREEVWRHTSHD